MVHQIKLILTIYILFTVERVLPIRGPDVNRYVNLHHNGFQVQIPRTEVQRREPCSGGDQASREASHTRKKLIVIN